LNRSAKSLAMLLAIVPLDPAFSFDSQRFSSNDDSLVINTVSRPEPKLDSFDLDPSGKIVSAPTSPAMNIIGFTPLPKTTDVEISTALEVSQSHVGTMNTSYSQSVSRSACRTSSLTALDIERLVDARALTYGVDPAFARAVAWTESRFDQNRTSAKGAQGAMQLMPGTALELGVGDPCNATANIDGGVRRLKQLVDEFQNPMLAAAAYNAGAQAVHDAGGIPPFGETVRYVASVTNYLMGLQPPNGASRRHAITSRPEPAQRAIDVIGASASRFVKGVMQF